MFKINYTIFNAEYENILIDFNEDLYKVCFVEISKFRSIFFHFNWLSTWWATRKIIILYKAVEKKNYSIWVLNHNKLSKLIKSETCIVFNKISKGNSNKWILIKAHWNVQQNNDREWRTNEIATDTFDTIVKVNFHWKAFELNSHFNIVIIPFLNLKCCCNIIRTFSW